MISLGLKINAANSGAILGDQGIASKGRVGSQGKSWEWEESWEPVEEFGSRRKVGRQGKSWEVRR